MHSPQVLVVGAGPTGLALALSLVRAGVAVRVVERGEATAAESRALDVQCRTLELYRQLGVADLLVERGVRVREVRVHRGRRTLAVRDVRGAGAGLSRYPFILCCPQDVHEALLVEQLAAAGVEVAWGTTLVALQPSPAGVTATLRGPDGTAEHLQVAYLAGCDGAGSTVREQLGTAFPGVTSGRRYFVADVSTTGPAAPPTSAGAFSFCLSRDDFMLVVPARAATGSRPDGVHRLVGLVPSELGDDRDPAFEDVRAVVERTTGTRVRQVHWFSTYGVAHRVAEHLREGRVFLLGDAGHVHSPLGGQGMNTGIGDALNLGWKLAAVLQDRADPALLATYEDERRPFARRLVATTDRVFDRVTGSGRRPRLARRLAFELLLPTLLRIPATRRVVSTAVGQTRLHYRGSTLSRGRAGRVRGGDRLPWVELGPGDGGAPRDNYAPLASLDWQVHVHGRVDARLRTGLRAGGLQLHAWPWTPAARRARLRRDAAYLVRPDGYVALADPQQDPATLLAHLDGLGLRPRRTGAGAGGGRR